MKKIFSALVACGLAVTLLVGCGPKAEPEATPPVEDVTPEVDADAEEPADVDADADADADGEKVVKVESEFDERGWKQVLEVTFDGDAIVDAKFDYENEAGELKSADEEYNTAMKEKSGVSAAEAMEALVAELIEKQDPEAIDAVTGATATSEGFIALAKEAIAQK